MTIILLLILCIYAVTIAQLIYGFGQIKKYQLTDSKPQTFFAIVVPFRNERDNLPALLETFRDLNYPEDLFEIILIDDFSEDDSVKQIYNWRMENGKFQTTLLENIHLSNSPKKDAISRAIPIIKNEWIITTDADCKVPQNGLLTLDNYIRDHEVSMIAGPVSYEAKRSFLHYFQQLDLFSLQGATIGSFGMGLGFMCNGANFAYKKSLFLELNGFSGNQNKASGDDVFLLQKAINKHPKKVHYLKAETSIVTTKPMDGWKSLFYQRVRWASKTTSYQSIFGKDLAVIVFFGNLAIIAGAVLLAFGLLQWISFTLLFGMKFIIDCILLYKTNQFLKGKMRYVLLSSLVYPFFCVSVAIYSLVGNYQWKDRNFR